MQPFHKLVPLGRLVHQLVVARTDEIFSILTNYRKTKNYILVSFTNTSSIDLSIVYDLMSKLEKQEPGLSREELVQERDALQVLFSALADECDCRKECLEVCIEEGKTKEEQLSRLKFVVASNCVSNCGLEFLYFSEKILPEVADYILAQHYKDMNGDLARDLNDEKERHPEEIQRRVIAYFHTLSSVSGRDHFQLHILSQGKDPQRNILKLNATK